MTTPEDRRASETLERNLRALARTCPKLVERLAETRPRADIEWVTTAEDAPSARLGTGDGARLLASARRPLTEATRLADKIEVTKAGAVLAVGFGLGLHIAEVGRRLGRTGVIVAFEPDIELLRSVLERVDHSGWIEKANLIILTDAEDSAAMSGAARGAEGVFALGVKVLEHPPSLPRLGEAGRAFVARFTQVVRSLRTNVVTTLVQVEATLRNQLMNLDHYAMVGGVGELAMLAEDRPAVVVSAGPSLARNVELLREPGMRDRVVIIAVQTVLKPLLEMGIRPHFVTALDYHHISTRFYEGLAPEDVEGVTLVAEAKSNPAILEAFPGVIRCPGDRVLDETLGPELRRPMGELPSGATVAHLAFYLARLLGCDPVILIGQDLGFTDGQYYAAGAAIHRVWSSELNEFNTLEMLEWQRIVRSRRTLRAMEDVHGRRIYVDEQMNAYLTQFERDFAESEAEGLRVIDATEGGVRKQHTEVSTLAEALEAHATGGGLAVDWPEPPRFDRERRLARVRERIGRLIEDVAGIGERSRRTASMLTEMREHHRDQIRVNRLIERSQAIGEEVKSMQPAFGLVQHLNQTGTLKRFRADRDIALDASLEGMDRQARQIERDIMNVSWMADAADQLGRMLEATREMLAGGEKQSRDPSVSSVMGRKGDQSERIRVSEGSPEVAAMMLVDPDRSPLGVERDLGEPLLGGRNPLRMALERVARSGRVRRAVLATHEVDRVRAIVGGKVDGIEVAYAPLDAPPLTGRERALRGARRWAPDCWRGGLGNMTVYDELLAPAVLGRAMDEHGVDAALVVGADWALVDPGLTGEVVARFLEDPERRFVFGHAPPGLCPCLATRDLLADLAKTGTSNRLLASFGALLGYVPVAPQHDPIASQSCVTPDPAVRDLATRCCADSDAGRERIRAALEGLDARALDVGASEIARRMAESWDLAPDAGPRHLALELIAGSGAPMDAGICRELLEQLADLRNDACVSFGAAAEHDVLDHPAWREMVCHAEAKGLPVHVRTGLRADESAAAALLEARPDVVSVDVLGRSSTVFSESDVARVLRGVERLLEHRITGPEPDALPSPWIVPRITRRDAVYEQIEGFFDRWLLQAGWCVIDPLDAPIEGERIAPIPLPEHARRRFERTTLRVSAEGGTLGASVVNTSLEVAWRELHTSGASPATISA